MALASHRISRTLWLAALVYAFWGLPVLGRLLAGVRYSHRFHLPALLAGLAAGALQDAAVFLQASTVLYFVKLLLDPPSPSAGAAESRFPNSGFLRNHLSPYARLPLYRPVLPTEYDPVVDPIASGLTASSSSSSARNPHLTLVASSPFAWRSRSRFSARERVPWGLSRASALSARTAAPSAMPADGNEFWPGVARVLRRVLVAALLLATVVLATVASVADFCLQVALHPRLDRARVYVFLSYASQFVAAFVERVSLSSSPGALDVNALDEVQEYGYYDDGGLPRSVVFSWSMYAALVVALTYGFFTGRLPLLPDVLHLPGKLVCSDRSWLCCCWRRDKLTARKNSLPLSLNDTEDAINPSSGSTSTQSRWAGWMGRLWSTLAWCWNCVWLSDASRQPARMRRRSGGSISLSAGSAPSSVNSGVLASMSTSWPSAAGATTTSTASIAYASLPVVVQKPVATLWRGVLMTMLTTLMALCTSLALDLHAGVDMPLMANAMFALETENLVARATGNAASLTVRHVVNCTLASQTLLDALDRAEDFSIDGIGNDDRCALLWRETTTFHGDALVELANLTRSDAVSVKSNDTSATNDGVHANATSATAVEATEQQPPNIIVIHMASWRHLDVGVLGGQTTKKKRHVIGDVRHSVTPQFDALAASGVLFTSHYTPCVTSTPCTLLTTLFGMQPPCADPSSSPFGSLKHFVGSSTTTGIETPPSAQVRGLPQFLKERGYQNVFWRATDLARDHEDEFLTLNGFDKLVDDRKVRQLLRDARANSGDVKTPTQDDDDHVGSGIHDHLSFEMLLFAIEEARNASLAVATNSDIAGNVSSSVANDTVSTVDKANVTSDADARNATTTVTATVLDANTSDSIVMLNVSAVKGRHYHPIVSSAPLVTDSSVANASTALNASLSIVDDEDAELETTTMAPPSMTVGLRAPFFIDMYSISSQSPYRVPHFFSPSSNDLAGLTTRFNRKYLQAMHFSDAMLGNFIVELREKGLMNNTIVMVTGDHGDGKLEHVTNPTARDSGVFDEVARIPFLLLADDFFADDDKGRRVDHLTTQMDLMATIADLLGVTADQPLLQHGIGRSMLRTRSNKQSDASGSSGTADENYREEAARWIDDMRGALLSGKEEADDQAKTTYDGDDAKRHPSDAEDDEGPHGRRVLLCNPFNGGTKGVRTSRDELKFVFFPDRSFSVFGEATDPRERAPTRRGFDLDDMDADTRAQLDFANEQLDLHAFLFQANKFVGDVAETEEATDAVPSLDDDERPSNATLSNATTASSEAAVKAPTLLRGEEGAVKTEEVASAKNEALAGVREGEVGK